MKGSESAGSPLESVAGVAGSRVAETFKLLSNETRLAILLALWEAYEPHSNADSLSFTALRDRVGVRQGGQFNYHLDQVVGEFVEKTDEGYALLRKGRMLVQSIIAGTGIEDPILEQTAIDARCDHCGARTAITYGNNYVYQVCTECPAEAPPDSPHPEGTLLAWTFEPTGLTDRTAEEVFTASTVKNYARIVLRFEGLCPVCSGPVDWSLDACSEHEPETDGVCAACDREDPVLAREQCTVCKSKGYGTPGIKVLFHPAVVSFFHHHGVELGLTGDTGFEDVVRTLEIVEGLEETVRSTEPLRVRVTATADGDALHLDLDEAMNVVQVREES